MRWISVVLAVLFPVLAAARNFDIAAAGSHAPDPEVLALVRAYLPHWIAWTSPEERDERRRTMVVPGYFYHDMNGSFVGFDALTERHTRNELTMLERKPYDMVLHQYETTAILTLKAWGRGRDKGRPFEGYGSAAIVMTKTDEGWRVAADIVGQEPDPPTKSPAAE